MPSASTLITDITRRKSTSSEPPPSLDGAPPRPPMKTQSGPSANTLALFGAGDPVGGGSALGPNAGGSSGRALAGVAMMLQGAQLISGVLPAAIPPELGAMLDSLRMTVPQALSDLTLNNGMNLMSSVGNPGVGMSPAAPPAPMQAPPMGGGTVPPMVPPVI